MARDINIRRSNKRKKRRTNALQNFGSPYSSVHLPKGLQFSLSDHIFRLCNGKMHNIAHSRLGGLHKSFVGSYPRTRFRFRRPMASHLPRYLFDRAFRRSSFSFISRSLAALLVGDSTLDLASSSCPSPSSICSPCFKCL